MKRKTNFYLFEIRAKVQHTTPFLLRIFGTLDICHSCCHMVLSVNLANVNVSQW